MNTKKNLRPIYYGNSEDFNKYIGPRLRNLIPPLTKKYKKEIGKCEHCGNSSIELDAAHRTSFKRKKIIKENLEAYRVDEECYNVDLEEFEKLYIESHKPISKVILVLCNKCHRKYDNLNTENPIKKILNLDKTSKIKPVTKSKNIHTKKEIKGMKIGQFVQHCFREAFDQNLIKDDEIKRLQDTAYSKNIFNANFEILRFKNVSTNDENGRARYYKKELFCRDYHLSSQWYEEQWDYLLKWLREIGYKYNKN